MLLALPSERSLQKTLSAAILSLLLKNQIQAENAENILQRHGEKKIRMETVTFLKVLKVLPSIGLVLDTVLYH